MKRKQKNDFKSLRNAWNPKESKFASPHGPSNSEEENTQRHNQDLSEPSLRALSREKDSDRVLLGLARAIKNAGERANIGGYSTGKAAELAFEVDSIYDIARLKLESPKSREELKESYLAIQLECLAWLCHIYNQVGDVKQSKKHQSRLKKRISDWPRGGNRKRLKHDSFILDIKNRNLNILFNDYRFMEALSLGKDLLKQAQQLQATKQDRLTGQILGSMGQACAFLSTQSSPHISHAKKYFKDSLNHFSDDDPLKALSINFLSTLEWKNLRYVQALSWMNKHESVPKFRSPEDLCRKILKIKPHLKQGGGYNAAGFLRIAVEQPSKLISTDDAEELADAFLKACTPDHPYQIIGKWIAYLCIRKDRITTAQIICQEILGLSHEAEFTIQTVLLPVRILELHCLGKLKKKNTPQVRGTLNEMLFELCRQSESFKEWLQAFNLSDDIDAMSDQNGQGLKRAVRFLPFNYS